MNRPEQAIERHAYCRSNERTLDMVENVNVSEGRMKKRRGRVSGRVFLSLYQSVFIIVLVLFCVSIGETKQYSLQVKNNSLFPSSELFLERGESITFKGADTPLTLRLENAMDTVELPASINAKREGSDLVIPLKENERVLVRFIQPGDFRFRIDGINAGLHAYKCGVDVLPHFVEGIIRVKG